MDVSSKNKFYITGAVIVCLAVVLVWGLYLYVFSYIISESASIMALQNQLATLEAKKDQARSGADDLISAKDALTGIHSVFFDQQAPLSFFEMLEAVATTTGVKMELTLGELENGPTPTQEFSINVWGQYSSVRKFLAMVELLPFEVVINTIQFQKNQVGFLNGARQEVRMTLILGVLTEKK